MSKVISKISDLVVDGSKIADKNDVFKEFFNGHDELLSSSSWGNLVKYMAEKAYVIDDLNDAYYYTLYTTYLNTFKEAVEYFSINENNFSMPNRNSIDFNYKEFEQDKINSNSLKLFFDEVFKEFIDNENYPKIQKFINGNIKYNYFKVLKDDALSLKKFIHRTIF